MALTDTSRTTVTDRSNEQWIEDLTSRGPQADAAQEELRRHLRRGLLRALSTRGDVDDALVEDFTQEAIIKVLAHLSTFRGDSRFTTWATAIAVRVAFTELRRSRWKDVRLSDLGTEAPLEITDVKVEDRLDRRTILEVMRRVIETELTEKQRNALLAELAGMPQAVLAERLETNRNALYKLVHDARKRLKRGILAAGISAEEVTSTFDL